jgi:DNA polymerase V
MFALIDGNSFYCSCERAFDPRLRTKPVVVLSNNDGCAIARTHEAKDLGIKMGEPYHLARKRPGCAEVIWKSSNYALYGDMSRRMYEVLLNHIASVEPYSIDEMFLDFVGINDRVVRAIEIRAAVLQATKIPTCVGIGPTKTIAKLANAMAKKDRAGSGVCDLSCAAVRQQKYQHAEIGSVWGLGQASVGKLAALGVVTISDLIAMPDDRVRELLSVVGLRTVWELRGIPCHAMGLAPPQRKSLAVTRSFGRPIESLGEMEQAIATYATRAAAKLRRHRLVAGAMQVFVQTNRFSKVDPQYVNQISVAIEATNDTFALMQTAQRAMRHLWRPGYRYAKTGIILIDLSAQSANIAGLFPSGDPVRSAALMAAIDRTNARFGRNTIRPAIVASVPSWGMRRANVSPSYTTRVEEIMRVRA